MFKDKKWDGIFTKRLWTYFNEMKWLYIELYNDKHAFEYFCDMLFHFYSERSRELKERDAAKRTKYGQIADNRAVGMQLYVDCFAGNLEGLRNSLDYIRETGVSFVHLMPLLESPVEKSDGGYAVSDFRKVQPSLGTMEELEEIIGELHKSGIQVCLDFVMNHTSDEHEWARKAKEGEKDYQNRYFFYDGWYIPNELEKTMPQVFPVTAPGNFTWCPEAQRVVMTTYHSYQWDLNYRNPTVFNDMTANLLYLCNRGCDMIRMDAISGTWKRMGTSCRNLPQIHTLIRIMRMAVDIVCPGTLLLGDVAVESEKELSYFGTQEKPECHMIYDAGTMATIWHTVATKDIRLLKHRLDKLFQQPGRYIFLNYLRNHDDIGWGLDYGFLKQFGTGEMAHKKFLNHYLVGTWYGSDSRGELYNNDSIHGDARLCGTTASFCGIETAVYDKNRARLEMGIRRDVMLHALLLAEGGVPILYSGDEIGQLNDYSYHKDPLKSEDSRYLHRGKMEKNSLALRTRKNTREGMIYTEINKLIHIRREHVVFSNDADVWVLDTGNNQVLGIGRFYRKEKLIALFNFSESDQTAWVYDKEKSIYIDLMTGAERPAGAVKVPGYGFVWLLAAF